MRSLVFVAVLGILGCLVTATAVSADCDCSVTGICTCAPGTCQCPGCQCTTVNPAYQNYLKLRAAAIRDNVPLLVWVGMYDCTSSLGFGPGEPVYHCVIDPGFGGLSSGLVVSAPSGGQLWWLGVIPTYPTRAAIERMLHSEPATPVRIPVFRSFGGCAGGRCGG